MTFKPFALTRAELLLAVAIKVLMGIAYGYIFLRFYNGDDTWELHRHSLIETQLLLKNPLQFFLNEYTPLHAMERGSGWLEIISLYINDLEYALLVKSMALFNLISQGNYYVNAALFNLIIFFGHYWLFLVMTRLFPESRKNLYLVIFCFLPALFWLSGIRADGLIFFFFSLMLTGLFNKGPVRWFRLAAIVPIFVLRPELGMLIAIAVTGYLLATLFGRTIAAFAVTYLAAIILFFATGASDFVVRKQKAFFQLKGTRFNLEPLSNDLASFMSVLPNALRNTFIRPYLWESKTVLQILSSAEILIFWFVAVMAFLFRRKDWKRRLSNPLMVMMLTCSVSVYLFVGYIVPFPGAIVRYKIIPELLIVSCMAVITKNINISKPSEKIVKQRGQD